MITSVLFEEKIMLVGNLYVQGDIGAMTRRKKESMIEAAVAHAMGEDEESLR